MGVRKAGAAAAIITVLVVLSGCNRIQPVYTVDKHPVPASAQRLPVSTIEKAITEAAYARGWTIEKSSPGTLRATEKWREHSASVEIRYSPQSYSIHYAGSTNLKADGEYIHRRYNALVRALEEEIERRLYNAAN